MKAFKSYHEVGTSFNKTSITKSSTEMLSFMEKFLLFTDIAPLEWNNVTRLWKIKFLSK